LYPEDGAICRHRRACDGFGAVVEQVGRRWQRPSPCPEWDARGVLEHVIGFHEVLLLRPLGIKANRPRDDIPGRWEATRSVIFAALDANYSHPVHLPDDSTLDVHSLLSMLTTDVLVHTWDLGRAAGVVVALDPELCELALSSARTNEARLRSAGMFGPPVEVSADEDTQSRLLAFLGRDPQWQED
jgi:uncharacterized protein (TIGR03086 family)